MMRLSITSIVVTHDVYESLKIVDYLYFVSEGRIVASGTPEEVHASGDPFVRQFVDGEPDGPVPFHYPAPAYREEIFSRCRLSWLPESRSGCVASVRAVTGAVAQLGLRRQVP